jgi:hypothetical protein
VSVRVEQSPDVGTRKGPHRYSDTPVFGVSVGSLAVTLIEGCVPPSTYSVVRFVPSIGYGTVAVAVVDVVAEPGDWTMSVTLRATHASARDVVRSHTSFTDSPLPRSDPSWARPPDVAFDECQLTRSAE